MALTEARAAALLRFPPNTDRVHFALEQAVNDVHALVGAGLADGALELCANPKDPRARDNGWSGRLTEAGLAARAEAEAMDRHHARLLPMAEAVLGDPKPAWLWFHDRQRILNDRRPLDVLDDPDGPDRVAAALERIFAAGFGANDGEDLPR